MKKEFDGWRALITGGTKGLGFSLAKLLAERGAGQLYVAYRSDEERARTAAASLRALGAKAEAIRADLSEDGGAERMFDELARHTDGLELYVHNAAATAFKNLMDLRSHHVDKTMNITVKSFLLGAQRAAALMPRGGAILSVSGMDTLRAVPRHGLLGAAKSALETLTAYFAHELAPRGIRVNGVNPGFLETDSTRTYLGPMFQAVSQGFSGATPSGRAPTLEEVAEVLLFLASPRSSWVVGQTIRVDGGFQFALPS
jgi:enoyl-[acyl-carrier protein] reductase III